jgi:hypothetical protein
MANDSPLAIGQNLLAEADPNSLDLLVESRITELFNTPPGELSDRDLEEMVKYFHSQRAMFMQKETAKLAAPKPKARGKTKAPKSIQEILPELEL